MGSQDGHFSESQLSAYVLMEISPVPPLSPPGVAVCTAPCSLAGETKKHGQQPVTWLPGRFGKVTRHRSIYSPRLERGLCLQRPCIRDASYYIDGIRAHYENREWQLALDLLIEMAENPVQHDMINFEECGEWQLALDLLAEMAENTGKQDTIAYNAAISACAMGGEWQLALGFLAEMAENTVQRNTLTYNAAINALGNSGDWELALGFLEDMAENTVPRNSNTFTAAINLCEERGEKQVAMSLLAEMVKTKQLEETDRIAAILAYGRSGKWELALEMAETAMQTNARVFRAAIFACGNSCEWQQALAVFAQMTENTVQQDTLAYSDAITACGKSGEWQLALNLLAEMAETTVQGDSSTHNAAMFACQASGAWQQALDILPMMGYHNIMTRSFAIRACAAAGEWQKALAIFSEIPQHKRNKWAVQSVLTAVSDKPVGPVLFNIARRAGMFPELLAERTDTLDLHGYSPGAALIALRWWLMQRVPPERETTSTTTSTRSRPLSIVTGWGEGRPVWKLKSGYKGVPEIVSQRLSSWDLPHEVVSKGGCFVLDPRDLKHRRMPYTW